MSRAVPTVPGGALLLALALAVGGCTSAPPPTDPAVAASPEAAGPPSVRQRLIDLVVGAYPSPEDVEEGGCFADELVGEVGEEALERAGVLDPANIEGMLPRLPKRMVDPWVESQFDCIDYVKLATRAQTFATNGRVDVMAYAACYGRKVSEDESRSAARAALLRKPRGPAWETVRAAEDSCLLEANRVAPPG
ncbi:hypothetical protein [Nocardioides solisilvae]|uniref:hypothetical protein n=1 Tax=Nocardioides solisilvae TaxID=1542435 RepID=UPI0013A5B4B5|nr:hypothetical protein [Nocardioides solisilvae]